MPRGAPPKPFIAISPDGKVHTGFGLGGFCARMDLSVLAAERNLKGETQTTADGWSFRRPDPDVDTTGWTVYRKSIEGVDVSKSPRGVSDPAASPRASATDAITMPEDPVGEAQALLDNDAITPEDRIRGLLDLAMRVGYGVTRDGEDPPAGWKAKDITELAKEYAKANGVDWSKVGDRRTDAMIFEDTVAQLMGNPDSIFEATDQQLDVMEAAMVKVEELAVSHWDTLSKRGDSAMHPDQHDGEPPGPKALAAAAHRWVTRIRRVRELARRAREPHDKDAPTKTRRIQESTHLLRFQLYVGRSNVKAKDAVGKLYDFDKIHVESAMALYLSRNGYGIVPGEGLLAPGDPWGPQGRPFEGIHYAGTLIMLPPRHGKTDMIYHDMGLEIDLNPSTQMAVVHDKEDEAAKILGAVKSMFNRDTAQGRRNYRLFPYELANYDNGATKLRVKTDSPPKNPNILAASVWTSAQGNNLDRLYGDDLVPQSDLHEAATRERRISAFHGTWGSRDQGACAFATLTGYPRHYDDLMWKTYKGAKRAAQTNGREGMMYFTVRRAVGGPNTTPKFKSIWDRYSASWLRNKYQSFGDRSLWNANYMLDPMPDDARIVQKVRIIDRESDEFHRFMATAEHHLSVDPAGTNNPGSSDKAGLVIGSLGTFYEERIDANGNMHLEQEQLLVISQADEFYANQVELIDRMVKIGQSRLMSQPINLAHVEVTGVGHAVTSLLENLHGINQIIEHKPTLAKPVRFKAVAGLFEHADPANSPAKIAFTGTRERDDNGEPILDRPLRIDPHLERIEQYIVNYNVETGFHSLDAGIQLAKFCRDHRHLGMGQGASESTFSGQVQRDGYDTRKTRWVAEQRRQQRSVSHPSAINHLRHEGI